MNMFCYQCQETGNGKGCTAMGICGKTDETANLQDLLIYLLQGMSFFASIVFKDDKNADTALLRQTGNLTTEALFTTVTNTDFDPERIIKYINRVIEQREKLRPLYEKAGVAEKIPDSASWKPASRDEIFRKSMNVGVLAETDADVRSVKETITYGMKGLSAYTYHAAVLNHYDDSIFRFIFRTMRKLDENVSLDELMSLALETGKYNLAAMDILDKANTAVYGMPQPVKVSTKPGNRPGILISGHELKDLEMLLAQSEGKGVDIYTNGEMILAQSLPFFRKFKHFAGNYGNAWWQQDREFELFNGPVLVTSNCIIPPEDSYKDRLFTTSIAGYPGVVHIEEKGGKKDFSPLIELALKSKPPQDLGEPDFMTGFGHGYLHTVKDKVIDLVKRGKIKRFVLMGGCDGRDPRRVYYKEKALALPPDTIILTAGCAKYRYIKEIKGDIEGIPRVLDAGQCSDNYSYIAFARDLAGSLGIKDLNELPLEFDIAWYDQKAVAILLTLLHLGIRKIKAGPTLPEFLTQYIIKKLSGSVEIATVVAD